MDFKYYPDEIAQALAKLADIDDKDMIDEAIETLYQLKAICENPYNKEYYRNFYRMLEAVANHTEY